MSEIPITCYDSLNKRYKCVKCGYCVSYTMGNTSTKKFKKHYYICMESNAENGIIKINNYLVEDK